MLLLWESWDVCGCREEDEATGIVSVNRKDQQESCPLVLLGAGPWPTGWVSWLQRLAPEHLDVDTRNSQIHGSVERNCPDLPFCIPVCRKRASLGDRHGLLVGTICDGLSSSVRCCRYLAAWAVERRHRLRSRQTCILLALLCSR